MALLRKQGYDLVQVVEKWVPQARKRIDLFGIIDIVAIRKDVPGILGIQATSMANISHRIRKAQESPAYPLWLANGNRFEVWGWGKRGPRGKRKLWSVRVVNDADIHVYGRRTPGDDREAATPDHGGEILDTAEQSNLEGHSIPKTQGDD
ncbi:MAG: hypothetical protein CL793_06325 [Chloroflexi bacterium]|nr:hypothetical protein [Chloroflexota bacterium]